MFDADYFLRDNMELNSNKLSQIVLERHRHSWSYWACIQAIALKKKLESILYKHHRGEEIIVEVLGAVPKLCTGPVPVEVS